MTLCLYECLRAVDLQRHYARFTSMGVRHVAHLSALTMEDYPILGICTMEDRFRLFHLVQMVKTDLENFEDDDDYGDEDYAVVDSSCTYNSYRYSDEEKENSAATDNLTAASFDKPSSICRRLDFSFESADPHRIRSCPEGSVHVYAGHNSNDGPVKDRKSVIPVQLKLYNESAVICGSKGNNNHRIDAHTNPSEDQTRGNNKPDIIGGISLYNSHTRLSPKYTSFHKSKPRPAAVTSKRFNNKRAGHKDRKGISMKEKFCAEKGSNGASGYAANPTPVYESKTTAGYNYGVPQSSPPALNKKRAGDQRISVCVRKRPLTNAESRRGEADVVTTPGGECVIVHESKEAVDLTQYMLQHRFYFDQVFGEKSTNEEVYRGTAYPLVQHMLNGGNATCFAYGQTGAGKTHTMLGSSPRRPGLYALAVRDIFAHLFTAHSPLLVYVSFFEIYCGQLYDLLDHRKRLFAREDGQKVVHIAGLRDVRVDSVTSLLEVISQGTEERTQGMSGVNPLSSRSHALLQIQLRGPNHQTAGRMWFVDLAGSERASDTKEPDRQSRIEGSEINQSLLALKECIRSLDQEQSHTPFRQSKLTQVLKDSFVGNSMTCMIANISPGHLATEHTLNTLRYADRVKELRGRGGLREWKKGKMLPSPKHNLSASNNSRSGTRGKSPPKKAKLGRQREDSGRTTPTTRLPLGGAVLCSTPKNSRWGEETSAWSRKGDGLEHITPIKGWVETGDKRKKWERTDERKCGKRENERYERIDCESASYQNAREGRMVRQPTDEQHHLWEEQKEKMAHESNLCFSSRESVSYQREKENQQRISKEGKEHREWLELQRQVESHRDTFSEVERQNERDLQKADEKDKERERHLRWYHQQLQQFMPSSSSSSPFQSSSFCSSNGTSVSASSYSSLQHSNLSVSALMHHGLEDVLNLYTTRVQVKADDNRGPLHFPSGKLESRSHAHGDSSGSGEKRRQDRGGRERKRSVEETGEARVRKENITPAGIEGGEKRWAWAETSEARHTDRMADARPSNVEAQVSYNCESEDRREVDKEGQYTSDLPAEEVWSTEEGGVADSCGSEPTHSNNDSNSLFNNPCHDLIHHRAPAERPLSPACEHSDTFLTQNKLSDVSSEITQTRCTSNILPLPLQHMSLLERPQAKTEQRNDTNEHCIIGMKKHPIPEGMRVSLQDNTQEPKAIAALKAPATPLNQSSCASMQKSDQQIMTPSAQHSSNTGASSSHDLIPNAVAQMPPKSAHNMHSKPALCISSQQSECVLGRLNNVPSQRHTVHSNQFRDSNNSFQPNSCPENAASQQIRPIMHLFTMEELDHAQWCVVQAHWEQLEEMESLCHKEGALLWQQPDMAFGEYVHKLEKIMQRKVQCVQSMRAQLQPYLKPSHSNQPHSQEEDNKNHN